MINKIFFIASASVAGMTNPPNHAPRVHFEERFVGNANRHFTTEEINAWLFEGKPAPTCEFQESVLANKQNGIRLQEKFAPKINFSAINSVSANGKYASRIAIYNGSITDIRADAGLTGAVGDSNSGDLFTGCGHAVATAVINAAGPNLQRDLYNQYGVPKLGGASEGALEYTQKVYGGAEGSGYSITCDAHDMRETHNIDRIEFMTVPMHETAGVQNMYKEAFEHSKDLDFIVLPMAGATHPVLKDKPELSAQIAMDEFVKFIERHPESRLKVVFAIFQNAECENIYREIALKL